MRRMLHRALLALSLGFLAVVSLISTGSASPIKAQSIARLGCGYWRWPVKTGTDADRLKVDRKGIVVTVRYLRTRPKPSSYPQDNRIWPTEFHTYQIDRVWLVAVKEEDDSDYHLVVHDSLGRTMIAEIPSPSCVGSISPWKTDIVSVRSYFNSHFHVSMSWQDFHKLVDIRGLGFLDEIHGQAGVAPNGVELHPVIWMKVLSSGSRGAWCKASAAPASDGYRGDYYVNIHSNQPYSEATAEDANDKWSEETNGSGYVRILLYHTHAGEPIHVSVGPARCSTTA